MIVRKRLAVLLLLPLMLCGCAKRNVPAQEALAFRTQLMQVGKCSFTADMKVDYGSRVYEFSVLASYTPEETKLTIQSPEEIAGICATVTENGTKLQFQESELEFGKLANGTVSPVSAPWLLVQCWIGEYIASSGSDADMERVTYLKGNADSELSVDTWFDKEGVPVHAEFIYDNFRCLIVDIRDFSF